MTSIYDTPYLVKDGFVYNLCHPKDQICEHCYQAGEETTSRVWYVAPMVYDIDNRSFKDYGPNELCESCLLDNSKGLDGVLVFAPNVRLAAELAAKFDKNEVELTNVNLVNGTIAALVYNGG